MTAKLVVSDFPVGPTGQLAIGAPAEVFQLGQTFKLIVGKHNRRSLRLGITFQAVAQQAELVQDMVCLLLIGLTQVLSNLVPRAETWIIDGQFTGCDPALAITFMDRSRQTKTSRFLEPLERSNTGKIAKKSDAPQISSPFESFSKDIIQPLALEISDIGSGELAQRFPLSGAEKNFKRSCPFREDQNPGRESQRLQHRPPTRVRGVKRENASFLEFGVAGTNMDCIIARHNPIQSWFGAIDLSAQPSDFESKGFSDRARPNKQKPIGGHQGATTLGEMFVQKIPSDIQLWQKKANRQAGIQFGRQCAATNGREAFDCRSSDKHLKRSAPTLSIKEIRRVSQPQNHFTKISREQHQMRSFTQADLRQECRIGKRIGLKSVRGRDSNGERIGRRYQSGSDALPSQIDRS